MDCVVLSLMDMKGHPQRIMNTSGVQQKKSADITVTGASKWHRDQMPFFTNINNKTSFIELLVGILQSKSQTTKCSDGYADILIVLAALDFSQNNQSVMVVAEDTDIFIVLIHHWKTNMADIFIRQESKTSSQKKVAEVYSIPEAHEDKGTVV